MLANLNNIADVSAGYAVNDLEHFAKITIDSAQVLVRKIEKQKGAVSKGCIVPDIEAENAVAALEVDSVMTGYLEWYRGQMIECAKSAIAQGSKYVLPEQIGMAAIATLCESQMFARSTITSAQLEAWFDSALAVELGNAFRLRVGKDQEEKIAKIVASYRGVVASLASDKTVLDDATRESVTKAIALIPHSAWTAWIGKRITPVSAKVTLEAL